ncbi:hypothetical protein [Myxacorys almedinensis]|uniref:Uncharacterized protein n=1 Tax=Myxacorys almedinensis A TaxID=2690445 RepID=A0A8J8CLD7_9CYAN|nr:hypothetical protein [Myxacorys almedinensis]NDJ19506.1 hypothetical protein [Myxacorys almedinensis A]
MARQFSWNAIKLASFSLPILALAIAGSARAANDNVKCIDMPVDFPGNPQVCAEKRGQGYDIYATLAGIATSQKQYVGADGVEVTLGTIDVAGNRAQVRGGVKRGPLRLETKTDACYSFFGVSKCAPTKSVTLKLPVSWDAAPSTPPPSTPSTPTAAKGSYQLFWDGQQVGHDPAWTRQQAIENLEWNKKTYPDKKVEGLFNGEKVGYELIMDGKRVGFEPGWNRQQAIDNLEWNKQTYPNIKVEGLLNGRKVGYELIMDGNRAGFAPGWNRQQAIDNLEWNKQTYPNMRVEGLFDGENLEARTQRLERK